MHRRQQAPSKALSSRPEVPVPAYIEEFDLQSITSLDLMQISELYSFDKNEVIIHQGVQSPNLYFLVDGAADVLYNSNNEHICVSRLEPVSWIGEAASLWKANPSCSVVAAEACTCVAVNLNLHRTELQHDVLFLQNNCHILAFRVNESGFSTKTLMEPLGMKLSRFILEYEMMGIFSYNLTTAAHIMNVSYRNLMRGLKKFCELGILRKGARGYIILDREQLEAFSQEFTDIKL
jgi:hypothetical protein